jgi:leucine dehydrogenase
VGSVLNDENVHRLRCKVIAGSALNIFTHVDLMEQTHENGVIYAPPFLIASGDLFLMNRNLKLGKVEDRLKGTKKIYNLMFNILNRAAEQNRSPYSIAKEDAKERYRKIDCIKSILC